MVKEEEPDWKKMKDSVELNEFSVQTDEEEESEILIIPKKNQSYLEDMASTQREALNWIKNGDFSDFALNEK